MKTAIPQLPTRSCSCLAIGLAGALLAFVSAAGLPAQTPKSAKPASVDPATHAAHVAAGIRPTPALGAVLMSASTVIVAVNARLLRLKNDQPQKKGETT